MPRTAPDFRRDVVELTSVLADGQRMGPERIEVEPKSLRRAAEGDGFFSYAAGVALEIVERFGPHGLSLELRADLPIPGEVFSFGTLELAQALGDFASLDAAKRRALHVQMPAPDRRPLREVMDALLERLPRSL